MHSKHGAKDRVRRWRHQWKKNKKAAVYSSLIICIGILLLAVMAVWGIMKQKNYQVTGGNSRDVGDGYRSVTYEGKDYQFNNRVTTILYAGLDSSGRLEQTAAYGGHAMVDNILLIVLDRDTKQMSVVAINKDTMTDVRQYTDTGNDIGVSRTHLGYAYSYGNGGKASCENLREAVSGLLGGLPIHEYIICSQTFIPKLNDMAGKVTVTVPNDDLKELHPELVSGATVTLDKGNVRDYLQYRDDSSVSGTEGYVQRQSSYIQALMDLLKEESDIDLSSNLSRLQNGMAEFDGWVQTSITENKYLSLVKTFDGIELPDGAYYMLEGKEEQGELQDEFHYDEESLRELVLKLFYLEV